MDDASGKGSACLKKLFDVWIKDDGFYKFVIFMVFTVKMFLLDGELYVHGYG